MRTERFPTHAAEDRLRELVANGVETVPLHGTPAPALPAHVVDAVADALATAGKVPPPRGLPALRERLAKEVSATGRVVDSEREVVVSNGAMQALGLCFRALLGRGDEVVVPAPCFFFGVPIRSAGGVPVYVAGDATSGWRWDADAIERSVGPNTRALLLCNPGNPTGHVPDGAEVKAAVAVAARHGLLVITDEAYEAMLWNSASLTSAFALSDRSLLIRSLGKSLCLPQLRLGFVAGPPDLVDEVAIALEWDVLRVGVAPQAAALGVLDGSHAWRLEIHTSLAADHEAAIAAFSHVAGLEFVRPRGGPFLFVSSGSLGLADELLAAGIPAVDGRHFQAPRWARVPFGGAAGARDALARALERWASRVG